ncbi:MAG: amidohydrolase family protein [Chloroflexota bacterium]|nr:amidohydrolase family protein [Chloroflexota bacterium]
MLMGVALAGAGGSLKIEGARFVVTVDPARRVIQDASVVCHGDRITHVGKADALRDVPAERTIDASGGVLTPAFVNGHMHMSYAHAVRGLFPDDFVGRDRLREVFRLQSAMTEEEEYWTSLLAVIELMRSGTVSFLDPGSTKYLDACLQVYADSGCRVVTGAGLIDRPSDLEIPCYATGEALRRTESFIRTYDHRLEDRVRAWAMPFSTETCSQQLLAGARRLADVYGTGATIHHAGGALVDGRRPTEYLEDIGALGPNVLLAHAAGIDDAEVDVITRSKASVVICPSTALKEGSGLGQRKLPELLARGVNVALGADSANSSNYLDAVRLMNAAAVGFKDGRQDVRAISAEQVLEMATILGAGALGMEHDIGSVETDKKADLVLFDTRRAEWRSLLDPVNNLVYSADGRSVRTVVANGRVVVDEGRVVFAEEVQVAGRVQELGEQLLARTGTRVNRGRWPVV